MNKTTASIISHIINPLIFPTLAVLVIMLNFQFGFSAEFKKTLILLVFSGTFFLPALFFPIFKYFKLIETFDIFNKKDRLFPLIIVFLSYFLSYLAFKKLGMPYIILICLLSSLVSLLISFFITIFWKISLHMIGVGGFIGMIIALMLYLHVPVTIYFLSFLLLVSGLLGTARLILDIHTPKQIYFGFFIGFIVVFSIFSLFYFK